MQLDSLLRSIKDNFKIPFEAIHILFHTSDNFFANGYKILTDRNYFDNIHWVKERHFRDDVYDIVNNRITNEKVMFLVDDNIVFRLFNDKRLLGYFSKRHLFISLRLSRKYNVNNNPKFINDSKYLEWEWYTLNKKKEKHNHWYYPFSIDGNIFKATDVKKVMKMIDFKAPNSFEGAMDSKKKKIYFFPRSKGLAPLNPVVFNNPLNIVQTEGKTWHMNSSLEMLNQKYLDGKVIDNRNIYNFMPDDIHCYCPVSFINYTE